MLTITEAEARRFTDSLTELEYSLATISKYAHDLRLLMDYAPNGIPDKAALAGFRAYLTERGCAPTSVNFILGAVNVFLAFFSSDWRLKYLHIQWKIYLDAAKELSHKEYERMIRAARNDGNGDRYLRHNSKVWQHNIGNRKAVCCDRHFAQPDGGGGKYVGDNWFYSLGQYDTYDGTG